MNFKPMKEPEVVANYGYKIPVAAVWLTQKELKNVQDAVVSTFISGGEGEFLDKFEKLFAEKTGSDYAVAVNSGTSALHIGYRLLGVGQGDEVIVPNFTMISTVTPLIELGATPVFVDCDEYGQIDVSKIEEKITDRTKVIVGTHIYGIPVDIHKVLEIAKKHKIKTLFDSAESIGAKYDRRKIGYFGDVNCYSMYANKNITTGEGGVVTFNNSAYLGEAKRLIDEYFSPEAHFWHESYGYSYRFSNVLAAIGVAQLERFDEIMKQKHQVMEWYKSMIKIEGIEFLQVPVYAESADWVVGIMVSDEFSIDRNSLRSYLAMQGIQTRAFFIPMHLQPIMQRYMKVGEKFPVSEKFAENGLYLPSSPMLSQQAIRYIADRVLEAFEIK